MAGFRRGEDFDAIVQLSGGLGNQLFQYAFGRNIELRDGVSVGFDMSFYDKPNEVPHNRPMLEELGLPVMRVSAPPTGVGLARKLKRLPRGLQAALFGLSYVKCQTGRPPKKTKHTVPTYYAGLWQSHVYFEENIDLLREEILSHLIAAVGTPFRVKRDTVGVHVRRGDYLTHKQSYNVDYETYVHRSLTSLVDQLGHTPKTIEIYSDDPDWCEQRLAIPGSNIKRGGGVLEDLAALAVCQHKILSNSTFAWWAGVVGRVEDGRVFIPKNWHRFGTTQRDGLVADENWTVVPAETPLKANEAHSCSARGTPKSRSVTGPAVLTF